MIFILYLSLNSQRLSKGFSTCRLIVIYIWKDDVYVCLSASSPRFVKGQNTPKNPKTTRQNEFGFRTTLLSVLVIKRSTEKHSSEKGPDDLYGKY